MESSVAVNDEDSKYLDGVPPRAGFNERNRVWEPPQRDATDDGGRAGENLFYDRRDSRSSEGSPIRGGPTRKCEYVTRSSEMSPVTHSDNSDQHRRSRSRSTPRISRKRESNTKRWEYRYSTSTSRESSPVTYNDNRASPKLRRRVTPLRDSSDRSRSGHCDVSVDEVRESRACCHGNNNDFDNPTRQVKRRRTQSRSISRDSPQNDNTDFTQNVNTLEINEKTTPNISLLNVIPEFNPMSKAHTIITWLAKVEECSQINSWNEAEIIQVALPNLTGIAKTWCQSLSTVICSWNEWKRELIEAFPCQKNYAELLKAMLSKRVGKGESLEKYYHTKINLLALCGIKGRKAVDCLIHGVDDRAVRVGAQAFGFFKPQDVLQYFITAKPNVNTGTRDRKRPKKFAPSNQTKANMKSELKMNVRCFNCNKDGHKSFKCTKPILNCTICGKKGHLNLFCKTVQK